MKKLLYLLSVTLVTLTSCSSDNDTDSPSQADLPLLKKYVITKDGNTTYTGEYIYNENKIVSFSDLNGNKSNYTYTEDLITKIEDINVKGITTLVREYSYSNGKLESVYYKSPYGEAAKIIYTHNQNGTVSYKKYFIELSNGYEEENDTGKFTFKDGNLIKSESFYSDGSPKELTTKEYDSKNSSNNNVLGRKLLLDYSSTSINNLVKETIVTFSGTKSTTTTSVYNITYDAKGYAIESTKISETNGTSTTQTIKYFY
ncbi:hypothetical protein EV143_11514 [Flavobacterium chryseum]|uniref:hypothetical protein n=1 Tax=Flavobacterium sp. P3160 TaxID=2512113 RepID=UPI00105D585A|nr:hypothetical protein [Flavobacterium sp. P3160]TDO68941.1 hypothetical protein EV143_11514 [Flavobacterium sp. P3160]